MALRILHVVPYYEQAWAYGGIPRLATTMTRALARRGHHVTVCTTDVRDEQTRASASGPNRPRHRCQDVSRTSPTRSPIICSFSLRLGFAPIHAPVGRPIRYRAHSRLPQPARRHCRVELSRAGVPYVVSPNGTARPIERRIIAKRLFACDRRALAAASRSPRHRGIPGRGEPTARDRRRGIVDRLRFQIRSTTRSSIVGPTERGFRRRLELGHAPIVLFLGKLTPRKGVDNLVQSVRCNRRAAAVRSSSPATTWVRATVVDSLIRRLGLTTRVIRAGLLTGETRLDALAAANVVVYPSRDEIFGLVPLEALLCGTPVVVCDDSGCGEVISATGGGLVVPPADITSSDRRDRSHPGG